MKVLHLSTCDVNGGAARAAYRVHQGLRGIGVESCMLVQSKASGDRTVIAPVRTWERFLARLRPHVDRLPLEFYPEREHAFYSVQWVPSNLCKKIVELDPDIVHLHWICDGYLNIKSISHLRRPLVWTLHDMWPFSGGCHYDQGCGRYVASCGACPLLHSSKERDISRWTWQRKFKAWRRIELAIITPSHWLAACTRQSTLFKNKHIKVIPNGLDTECFKPVDRKVARAILSLPLQSSLILFGAINATTNPRKGYGLLQATFRHLSDIVHSDKLEGVIFGASGSEHSPDWGLSMHYLGHLHDDSSLALVYSAADVFVAPSKQDNLPNTVVEALACGTPCVAFNVGGMPDMIDYQGNGYLAEPFRAEDLAYGIKWILENKERHQILSQNARRKAVREFDQELQAWRYLALYEDILDRRRACVVQH